MATDDADASEAASPLLTGIVANFALPMLLKMAANIEVEPTEDVVCALLSDAVTVVGAGAGDLAATVTVLELVISGIDVSPRRGGGLIGLDIGGVT